MYSGSNDSGDSEETRLQSVALSGKGKKRTCSKMLRGDLQNMTDEDWEELVHDAHRVDWGIQERIINNM
jgi:hypothetical protein